MTDLPDGRYTLRLEWAGYERPVWVARFCEEWLGCDYSQEIAFKFIAHHRLRFLCESEITK